jgi:hypothetical protein
MAKSKRGPIGGTIVDYGDAQRAESVLKAAKVDVSIECVTDIMCPGTVRRDGYILVVPSIDRARAIRVLKENGFSCYLAGATWSGKNTRTRL